MVDKETGQRLIRKYRPAAPPLCCVCGGELSIQSAGGGEPTIWACSGMVGGRFVEGRRPADDHYSRSSWVDYGRGGDEDVIELLRECDEWRAKAERAAEICDEVGRECLKQATSAALSVAESRMFEAWALGATDCARAIRSMLEENLS